MPDEQKEQSEGQDKGNDKNLLTEELPGGGLTHEEFDNAGAAPHKRSKLEEEEDDESDDE